MSGESSRLHLVYPNGERVPLSGRSHPESRDNYAQLSEIVRLLRGLRRILTRIVANETTSQLRIAGTAPIVTTVEDLLPEWQQYLESRGGKDYAEDCVTRVRRLCRDRQWTSPQQITTKGVMDFLVQESTRLEPRTLNHYRSTAFTFCDWCIAGGLMTANPVRGVKKWPVPKGSTRYAPTIAQVRRLIEAVAAKPKQKKDRWLAYLVAATTGLRTGTLRGLTWAMVKLDDGPYPYLEIPGKLLKNKRAARIWLTREAAYFLRRERDRRRAGPTDRVLVSVGDIANFDVDLRAAAIPKHDPATGTVFVYHSLRHFANMYLASGDALSIKQRQSQMTHETPAMTAGTYFHSDHELVAQKIFNLQPIMGQDFGITEQAQPPDFSPLPLASGPDSRHTSRARSSNSETSPIQPPVPTPPRSGLATDRRCLHKTAGALAVASRQHGAERISDDISNRATGSNPVTLILPPGTLNNGVLLDKAAIVRSIEKALDMLAGLLREEQADGRVAEGNNRVG